MKSIFVLADPLKVPCEVFLVTRMQNVTNSVLFYCWTDLQNLLLDFWCTLIGIYQWDVVISLSTNNHYMIFPKLRRTNLINSMSYHHNLSLGCCNILHLCWKVNYEVKHKLLCIHLCNSLCNFQSYFKASHKRF